jgi:hypothetical protein
MTTKEIFLYARGRAKVVGPFGEVFTYSIPGPVEEKVYHRCTLWLQADSDAEGINPVILDESGFAALDRWDRLPPTVMGLNGVPQGAADELIAYAAVMLELNK